MAQIFHPSMNIVAKVTIFGAVFILAGIAWAGGVLVRSPYITEVNVVRDQPVPFSHRHHAKELGIDCRYCHSSVEKSAFAGMPATEVCMGCHSQIWKDSDVLKPVRESFSQGKPLEWTRVNDLPDFVYFNHSIHIAKGVACEMCHGRVDEMPLMRRAVTLHMEWCVKCHRNPNRQVRNKEDIYKFGFTSMEQQGGSSTRGTTHAGGVLLEVMRKDDVPSSGPADRRTSRDLGLRSVSQERTDKRGVALQQLTDCVVCHR